MNSEAPYTLLALAVLVLAALPVGIAVFVLGFLYGDSPCVMCWEQRAGMALVALIGLFVLRYGARPKYIGLAILVGAYGLYMGIRHSSLHVARDIGQGFSIELLGAHTYTWSVFIFWVCIVTMGGLLLLLKDAAADPAPRKFRPVEGATAAVLLVVLGGNIVQAFASTGPPPFMGQSDPVRFSFDPGHWVWSTEEWKPSPVSLRGRWSVPKPALNSLPPDAADGPLADLPALPLKRGTRIELPIEGAPTDLAFDAASGRFVLTTPGGIYLTDSDFARVLDYALVDTGYSVDLARFSGVCFLDSATVMALSENKSYVIVRKTDNADNAPDFRFFLKSSGRFEEVTRSRLSTVRARMMYVMALSFSPTEHSIYTVSVPNTWTRRLVVSRFDQRDMTLSEEFVLEAAPGGPALRGRGRSLGEYFVTGAAVAGGEMIALSASYSTLMVIDLEQKALTAAYALPRLDRPSGLALRDGELYVLNEEGTLSVFDLPSRTR